MEIKKLPEKIWEYLKKDSWDSWIVSIILVFLVIKFIFFPLMSLITGSALPLVIVESCSMYHHSDFESWWIDNSEWYKLHNIQKSEFESWNFPNGLNKGDIILVVGSKEYKKGDIIIFNAQSKYPLIHRIISESPISTKGDNNFMQLEMEKEIPKEAVIGKAVFRIPILGWIKLIFFEPFKEEGQRGLCV
ncbi:MAG: hypothetical protein N3D20_03120 [Candidatus Pacearchaeota archaeon]|nr:hypothetical protein [Candidatus Pacearchaeota archaeon]